MAARRKKATKKSAPRKTPGRKPFAPTEWEREQVRELAGFGLTHREIACIIRSRDKKARHISSNTLAKHFRDELDTGAALANHSVVHALWKNAVDAMNVTAQIWWTKKRMGWEDADQMSPEEYVRRVRQALGEAAQGAEGGYE